jgi:hypothetical protein
MELQEQLGRNARRTRHWWHNAGHYQDQIHFVLDTRTLCGLSWAREFMAQVEGVDHWPQHVQAAVQAAEREALE